MRATKGGNQAQADVTSDAALPRILLVGNPNTGKSTLFNLLTGANQKTMNAPRTTVMFEAGKWKLGAQAGTGPASVALVDLPGTYSLLAQSPDEQVTAAAVWPPVDDAAPPAPAHLTSVDAPVPNDSSTGDTELIVALLDASAPASSLYLIAQMGALGLPMVVAVSMADVARGRGVLVDTAEIRDVLGVPVVEVDPRRGKGAERLAETVAAALAEAAHPKLSIPVKADSLEDLDPQAAALFEWVANTAEAAGLERPPQPVGSDRVDRWLLKWWIGIPTLLAVLWTVFQLTTAVAGPLQDLFASFITDTVGGWLAKGLAAVGWGGGWFESFLLNGLLAGVGIVVSFVPLMAIIFLAIALLEDSGYMARAALMTDRLMRLIGLDGRAVLPLVIGFGCNIPAIAATKALPDARQRLLTGLLAPYASCTARLVIFLFIASVFFPDHAGNVVFVMYLISVAAIILVGLALRRTAFRSVGAGPLILVLPPYQLPRVGPLLRSVALRCRGFVIKAGQVIVVLSILVWALLSIPITSGYSIGDDIPPKQTVLGGAAHLVAPIFAPAGFDDWHMTASLMTGFVAKEAAVGTLATTFGMDEPADPTQPGDLAPQVRAALDSSSGGHPGPAAWAYMVFCLGYTPCMATVAEQRRVYGAKPVLAALGLSLVISWLAAVAVFQIGVLL